MLPLTFSVCCRVIDRSRIFSESFLIWSMLMRLMIQLTRKMMTTAKTMSMVTPCIPVGELLCAMSVSI